MRNCLSRPNGAHARVLLIHRIAEDPSPPKKMHVKSNQNSAVVCLQLHRQPPGQTATGHRQHGRKQRQTRRHLPASTTMKRKQRAWPLWRPVLHVPECTATQQHLRHMLRSRRSLRQHQQKHNAGRLSSRCGGWRLSAAAPTKEPTLGACRACRVAARVSVWEHAHMHAQHRVPAWPVRRLAVAAPGGCAAWLLRLAVAAARRCCAEPVLRLAAQCGRFVSWWWPLWRLAAQCGSITTSTTWAPAAWPLWCLAAQCGMS